MTEHDPYNTGAPGMAAPDSNPYPETVIDNAAQGQVNDMVTGQAPADDTGMDPDVDAAPVDTMQTYADFDIPAGVTVQEADITAYRELSGEMGLTQDQAQRLLTFEAERLRQAEDQLTGQQLDQARDWAQAARADAEFGGDAFDRNVGIARQAMEQFGSDEVQEILNATGLGSHPEFIRMFWKMGRSVASDGAVIGGHGGGSTRLDNRSLFPNSNHN